MGRSFAIAEFSFGDLVATTSGSHFDEFGANLLQTLSARDGKFDDSGVELSVSATMDLFFTQPDFSAALEYEYSVHQEIGAADRNHSVVCRYCEDSFGQFIEIGVPCNPTLFEGMGGACTRQMNSL